MSLYEGMFLFDSARVQEWPAVETELKRLFDRIGATQRVAIKFDDRKLAYEIEKRKRGLYVLVYFDADTQKIGELERDVRLSEVLLRVLILKAVNVTEKRIEELKSKPADQSIAPPPAERRYGDHRFGGGRDDRGGDRRPRGRDRHEDSPRRDDKPESKAEPKAETKVETKAEPKAEPKADAAVASTAEPAGD